MGGGTSAGFGRAFGHGPRSRPAGKKGAGPWPLRGVGLLETLDRIRGGGVDLEELVELGDGENLVDLGVDVGEAELAALGVDLVADGDQGPEGGRGEVVDVAEADEQAGPGAGLDQGGEFLPDVLDVGLVEDVAVDELDLGDVGADLFDAEARG